MHLDNIDCVFLYYIAKIHKQITDLHIIMLEYKN